MSSIASIGLSGMRVAEMRLQAAASNVANVETVGRVPQGDVYEPVDVVQIAGGTGGVSGSFAPRSDGYNLVSQPDSPLANANGIVAAPNVDLATELVNVAMARLAYAASAGVVRTANEMAETIDKLA
jgi:flagellar basal-body rod protein FlgC